MLVLFISGQKKGVISGVWRERKLVLSGGVKRRAAEVLKWAGKGVCGLVGERRRGGGDRRGGLVRNGERVEGRDSERKRCRARQFDLLAEKVMARLRSGTCGKSEPSGKSGDRTAPERKRCRARQFDLLAEKVMARLRSGTCGKSEPSGKSGDRTAPERKGAGLDSSTSSRKK